MKSDRFAFILSVIGVLTFSLHVGAEVVDISGVVRDQSDGQVAGAEVSLGEKNITATTNSDGSFHLTGEFVSVRRQKLSPAKSSASLLGADIKVTLSKSSPVAITMYTVAGRKVYDFTSKPLNSGLNIISLPLERFGEGAYIVDVAHEGARSVFRYVTSTPGGKGLLMHGKTSADATDALRKSATIMEAAVDTLMVTAQDYHPANFPITSYSQSGIEIVLEPINVEDTSGSRLDNITKSCDHVPAPISGGQKGWGSRYWDCCKPHCSWPENTDTTNMCANCDINDDEIETYSIIGDEHWTGLQGTPSGCEQDGEAYTCYSQIPFAVCDSLAYGFAAVPVEGDVCGKCFQLDFDGGFKDYEPKEAHGLVAGKTMIVMASNVGHDVSGGQFDIMIPGGGLGNFIHGCARQWGVDVNDESLVGVKSGGFLSACQKTLGWDAPADDYKECVSGMCDQLFGQDESMRDLWEGCMWYVEWMHAVDNPTFTYKEVECPQELMDLYRSNVPPEIEVTQ